MRKVQIPADASPPADWLEQAERISQQLQACASEAERQELIEAKQALWRDQRIRDWLMRLFHDKCWYSEARESVSALHVDHYRPKGRVQELNGQQSAGYWWLAFDWRNYRMAGQLINVKKRDHFPLQEGARAQPGDRLSLQLEAPLLIDPTSDEASLISFELDEDACLATQSAGADAREQAQAAHSIDILGLNRLPPLNRKRADTWRKCLGLIQDYQQANSDGAPAVLAKVTKAMVTKQLREMLRYEAEFSAVAQACVRKHAPEGLRGRLGLAA
ncbi:hypothetical protein V8J88_07775 [Massilia sp. W12]|uniref:hypothetical protein n=1 Tax=Massilia sp. W12 TaxID=3126507 RepID=UPI0030D4E6C0